MKRGNALIYALYIAAMLITAGQAKAYSIGYVGQVFPLNTYDASLYRTNLTLHDSETSTGFNSELLLSSNPPGCEEYGPRYECISYYDQGYGQTAAYVDLATGRISLSGYAGGYQSLASSGGWFQDSLTFNLPANMTQAVIEFSMVISGNYSTTTSGCQITGYASISLGGVTSHNGGDRCADTFVGQTFSGQLAVQDNQTINIQAYVRADAVPQHWGFAFYDLSHTAAVSLQLPDGVTFTSESGVFLSAVPLPSAVYIFSSGLLGLVSIARRHKGFRQLHNSADMTRGYELGEPLPSKKRPQYLA